MTTLLLKAGILLFAIFIQASGDLCGPANALHKCTPEEEKDIKRGAAIPDCPPNMRIPLHCTFDMRTAGFCYDPAAGTHTVTNDLGERVADQPRKMDCLTGGEMGDGQDGEVNGFTRQCPSDKPVKCRFVGSDNGYYNDLMWLGLLTLPTGVIMAGIYFQNKKQKQLAALAAQGKTDPLLV